MKRVLLLSILMILSSIPLAQATEPRLCLGKKATIYEPNRKVVRGTDGPDVIVTASRNLNVYGRGGDDLICGDSASNNIFGGPGDDRILDYGNWDTDQILSGGVGDDRIQGRAAEARGGPGDDFIKTFDGGFSFGGSGNDEMSARSGSLDPGAGSDVIHVLDGYTTTLLYKNEPGPVYVDLTEGFAATPRGRDQITGNPYVQGTAFDDVIKLGEGFGHAEGKRGNDRLIGGPFGDTLKGGRGDDLLVGGGGDDSLDGGPDFARNGKDVLRGGPGDDFMTPGSGDDVVEGGDDHDTVSYGRGVPLTVDLSKGVATGQGVDSLDSIEGVLGSTKADLLIGTDGDNTFQPWGASDGVDQVIGKGGDDEVSAGRGEMFFDGGDGSDLARYDGNQVGIDADLSEDEVHYGTRVDMVPNVESITGTSHGDRLIGDEGDNTLIGRHGDDHVDGGAGDDNLSGDCDLLPADSSSDYCFGKDTVSGGDGDDALYGGPSDDLLDGGFGTDFASGGDGIDACVNNESEEECETSNPKRATQKGERLDKRDHFQLWRVVDRPHTD